MKKPFVFVFATGILFGSLSYDKPVDCYVTDSNGVLNIKYPDTLPQCKDFTVLNTNGDTLKPFYTSTQYDCTIELRSKKKDTIIIKFK